jgi:hypothetical protein
MRSNYLGELQGTGARFEEFSLKPLPLERMRDIIEGPARIASLMIDDALVMAAIKDANTGDALPLLAFALRELYDRIGSSGKLTVEGYRALGDEETGLSALENAVRRKADEVLKDARPSPEQLQALKAAFVPALVRINVDGEYMRRPARVDSLPDQARPLIETLVKARLLVLRHESDTAIVEVAHEALLRKWPLLRSWLDEEREFLIGKRDLEQEVSDWKRAAKSSEALLSGLKLARAHEWLKRKSHLLNESEREFIKASISQERGDTAFNWVVVCASMLFLLQDTFFMMIVYYQLNAIYLRIATIAISFIFGAVLLWRLRCTFKHALALGAIAGIFGLLCMLIMVSAIDNVSLLPQNAVEWRETAEFAASMTFATIAGNAAAEFAQKVFRGATDAKHPLLTAGIVGASIIASLYFGLRALLN